MEFAWLLFMLLFGNWAPAASVRPVFRLRFDVSDGDRAAQKILSDLDVWGSVKTMSWDGAKLQVVWEAADAYRATWPKKYITYPQAGGTLRSQRPL